MGTRRHRRRSAHSRMIALAAAVASVLLAVPATGTAQAAPTRPAAPAVERDLPATAPVVRAPAGVPAAARAAVLGAGWRTSTDRAWLTSGDADAFHLLVADAAAGYAWRPVAALAEPGVETDQWIGNGCVTGSGRRAVVVYAPRTFTNDEQLFDRGGFTAVVDLVTGAVRKLPVRTSLAYFNPACGAGEEAVLTQAGDLDLGRTRLIRLDAVTGALVAKVVVPGQLTSPVPTPAGIVAADSGALVRVGANGVRRVLAPAAGVPFRLAADADGGVVFLQRSGADRVAVRRTTVPATGPGAVRTVATGPLSGVDVTAGRGGRVFITGTTSPTSAALPTSVSRVDVAAGARLSMQGALAVTSVRAAQPDPRVAAGGEAATQPLAIAATALTTGTPVAFGLTADALSAAAAAAAGRELSPAVSGRSRPTQAPTTRTPTTRAPAAVPGRPSGGASIAAGDPSSPADFADRYCSVPRNDPASQAMQPKPRQVEWAVDQAVRGVLTVSRPANWKNLGMPAYTPQGLFPPTALAGGGVVPAQIMLGIAAQESNLWQAPRFVLPGDTGNPLIGNYFGLDIYNDTEADDWTIRWDKADCGYGVTQVTDGMRLAGREKPGETARPYQTQRAIALDFAANVAAGLQILQSKWNQTRNAGLVINNGDPAKIENWFFAVWAYNSGFHADPGGGQPWGVGWANNPANPRYPANRKAFLDTTYDDAAHPERWPYPEKVMGWAGHPVEVPESPTTLVSGYRAAWWSGGDIVGPVNRTKVKPPVTQFCDASNQCEPGAQHLPDDPAVIGEPAGPCAHRNAAGRYDLQCWYHVPNTWKPDCATTCGNELLRFDPGYAYQDDGTSYPPNCSLAQLPSNAQVIDDVPDGTPVVRPGCTKPGTNAGTFTFTYRPDDAGQYPGKIDTHQIGGGFGGHFWFSRTRTAGMHGGRLEVKGTWRFNQTELGFGRVLVHLPDHRAQSRIARYVVKTAFGERVSVVQQPGIGNRWVSIGVWRFGNRPEVSLSTVTPDGNGTQDVAFDAVAFVPIPQVETLEVLDWNIAGGVKNHGEFDVVERIVREVQERRPDIISLNEVCIQQFEHLTSRLAEIGYPMGGYFSAAQLIVPTCAHGLDPRISNGNAVLVRAPISRTQSYMFESTDPTIPDNTLVERTALPGESKGVACLTAQFPNTFQDTKVCSTHLVARKSGEPNPYREAEEETREMVRVFGTEARNMAFILAGDFNIKTPPANDVLGTVYTASLSTIDWTNSGNFKEVDQERQCVHAVPCELAQGGEATHPQDGGEKIDYVFASRWYFTVPVGRVEIISGDRLGTCGDDNHPCSDHFMMRSEVQLPPLVQQ